MSLAEEEEDIAVDVCVLDHKGQRRGSLWGFRAVKELLEVKPKTNELDWWRMIARDQYEPGKGKEWFNT